MKVIINGRFLLHRVTGVERYARELCSELDKLIKTEEVLIAVPPEAADVPSYENIKVVKVGHLHNRLWEHISFPMYVSKQKAISLNLCNVAPLPSPGIVAIHDVKIKATPQYFSKRFIAWYNLLFSNVAKRAKKIITVSEFSKREIEKYCSVIPEKLAVVPSAWQHYARIVYDDNALEKYGLLKDGYYFSMSSLEPNKNFKWVAEVAKRNSDQVFVVAGSINETVFADGLGFECPKNMKLLGYVSDEEAKALMRDCKAFLFPTFYEGFGLPPLEAISAGAKQVIVSDTEVMHEIYGNCATYINPYEYIFDFRSITELNPSETKELLNKYSWKKSAVLLKNIIDADETFGE